MYLLEMFAKCCGLKLACDEREFRKGKSLTKLSYYDWPMINTCKFSCTKQLSLNCNKVHSNCVLLAQFHSAVHGRIPEWTGVVFSRTVRYRVHVVLLVLRCCCCSLVGMYSFTCLLTSRHLSTGQIVHVHDFN